jgi:hypothetical protein
MTANDTITGPVRSPRNLAANVAGSIHDDATATSLGFRGGTVAGSIHMDQFPPLLLAAFGDRWFETGSLSLYFRHATTDGEPVQAFLERPEPGEPDVQVRAWAITGEDALVAEGTASVGNPAAASALYSRDLRPAEPGELRILSAMKRGDVLGDYRLQCRRRAPVFGNPAGRDDRASGLVHGGVAVGWPDRLAIGGSRTALHPPAGRR